VRKGELTAANLTLRVPPKHRRLQVILAPDKERYQPTETATYTITTRDAQGRGVPAEVGLGVVDAGVYEVRPDPTPDPFAGEPLSWRRLSTVRRRRGDGEGGGAGCQGLR